MSAARIHEFRHGDCRVLMPSVYPDLARPGNLDAMARANHLHVTWVQEPPGLFAERWDAARLEREHGSNSDLEAFYTQILAVVDASPPRAVLIMGDGGRWHPTFVEALRRRTMVAFWTGDDPEGSPVTSQPFVRYYDHVFCGGIYFSAAERIADKFVEWGAPKATFIPLGGCPDKFRPQGTKSDAEFFQGQRDIDVIYAGAAYKKKLWRIVALKRHFGDRLVLRGRRWDGKGMGWRGVALRGVRRLTGLHDIFEVTDGELVALYQRAKIGFNCHLSYGPSNLRLYELPLNGVMQVCDCPEGLSELYRLGREVVPFRTFPEATRLIEHYLRHEDERAQIAQAGHQRAVRDYPMEHSFRRLIAALGLASPPRTADAS